jgi:hypothetical protein
VSSAEFAALHAALFPKAQPGSADRAFGALDLEGAGRVDIISWSHRIRLADMPAMVERIRRHGVCVRVLSQGRGCCLSAELRVLPLPPPPNLSNETTPKPHGRHLNAPRERAVCRVAHTRGGGAGRGPAGPRGAARGSGSRQGRAADD